MEGCAEQESTADKRAAGNQNSVDTEHEQKAEKP
jgi:hypothetical protein